MEPTFEQREQQVINERTYLEKQRSDLIKHEQKMARFDVYKTAIIALTCILITIIVMHSLFSAHFECDQRFEYLHPCHIDSAK